MNYKDLNDYELLSMQENEEASELLYKKYRPLIYKIAKNMYSTNKFKGVEFSDFIQEGNIGFTNAIQNYDEKKDILFFTYAKTCIEKAIISFIVKNNRQKNKILNESISIETFDTQIGFNELDRVIVNKSVDPLNLIVNNKQDYYSTLKSKLTELEFNVLELKDYGFETKEIADLLNKDVKAIDNALQRIKFKVKKIDKTLDF